MTQIKPIEVDLFLEAVFECYGYDFRQYAKMSITRRLEHILSKYKLNHIGECQHRIIHDRLFFYRILNELTITVTELFRDPNIYSCIKKEVFSFLASYPSRKIWHAGCATGEEVLSMAILLSLSNLYDHTVVYGTDINMSALEYAKNGVLSNHAIEIGQKNFKQLNLSQEHLPYVTYTPDGGIIDKKILKNILYTEHNLVTDQAFGEMQLILCRNVLIYFERPLQERALELLTDSLCDGGYLCLGSKESLKFSDVVNQYDVIDSSVRLYRKKDTRKSS